MRQQEPLRQQQHEEALQRQQAEAIRQQAQQEAAKQQQAQLQAEFLPRLKSQQMKIFASGSFSSDHRFLIEFSPSVSHKLKTF